MSYVLFLLYELYRHLDGLELRGVHRGVFLCAYLVALVLVRGSYYRYGTDFSFDSTPIHID